jgi:hypothetical protein
VRDTDTPLEGGCPVMSRGTPRDNVPQCPAMSRLSRRMKKAFEIRENQHFRRDILNF